MIAKLKHILIWSLIAIFLLNIYLRGIIVFDEGQILNAAQKVIDGQLPYRDFQFFYTPGSIFSLALVFKLFGASVLIERLFALLVSLISTFFIFRTVRLVTKNIYASYLSVILFVLWSPSIINFIWPVNFCVLFGIINSYALVKFLKTENKNYLFYAGIASALILLFKQNFGGAILFSNLLLFYLIPELKNKINFGKYLYGYIAVIIIFIAYLLSTNTLGIFIEEMYFVMFEKIFKEGMLATPFIYNGAWYIKTLRTVFYLSPLIISLVAVKQTYKKNTEGLVLAIFAATFYLAGIRPTTDFVHLAPLIAISVFPLAILYLNKKIRSLIIFTFYILMGIGLYSLFFRGYYRWEAPILKNNIFYGGKVNLFINDKHKILFDKVIPILKKSKSEYIFIYHYSPAFYFLADKKNPTKYDNLPPEIFTTEIQKEAVRNITNAGVDTILLDKGIGDKTIFAEFIKENYVKTHQFSELSIWEKQ